MINTTGTNNTSSTYGSYNIKNQSLIQEYRQAFRLTEKDSVQIYVMPKGKAGNMAGSFIYKHLSSKAQQLILEQNRYKRKIQDLQFSDIPEEEKLPKIHKLRNLLRYVSHMLDAEIVSLPRSGFIVVEESGKD